MEKEKINRQYLSSLLFAMLIMLFVVVFVRFSLFSNKKTVTTIDPTCTEPGQILTEDDRTHTVVAETIPATGHSFNEWYPVNDIFEERICTVCGEKEVRIAMTDEEHEMPHLMLNGSMDGVNKKVKVILDASFSGKGEEFDCYAITTMQGHSTLGLDKSNYTLRFFDDKDGEKKHKISFGNWNKEHKYIIKADYYDVTQCRNLVGAQIWRELVQTRENVPQRISSLPTLGAVDGFPVSVSLNDEFFGLYTLCLHKDDDLFGMEEGEQAAILICNQNTEDEAVFRAPAVLDKEGEHDWELEFCGTENDTWARDSFNRLINFVMYSSDEEFRTHLGEYLDVDSAVDYLIFIYTLGLVNSGAKDMVLVSYGDQWISSAYDMDEAFGLMPGGSGLYKPDQFLPEKENGVWSSGTGSLLWDRLLQNYEDVIQVRYQALRSEVLSEEKILGAVDSFTGAIPESIYLRDAERYPGRPEVKQMINQIHTYMTERLPLLDAALGGK